MPTIGDYIKATQDRLWSIWEADTGAGSFTDLVRPGNRIKRTGNSPWPVKTAKAAADLGEADLMVFRGTLAGFAGDTAKTFGNTSNSPPCDFVAPNQIVYQLLTTWPDLRNSNATALLTRVEALLFDAGSRLAFGSPRVALAGVAMWGPITFTHVEQATGSANGTLRLIQRIQIPVYYRLNKALILG